MKRVIRLLITVVLTLVVGVMTAYAGKEEGISLDKVPKKVLEVCRKAVPGIKLVEAEVEKTRNGSIYEIEGILNGKKYEIEVSADGKVLEVEEEDDDENDNDDDNDHEKDGDNEDSEDDD